MKEQIREKLIECFFYLSQAMLNDNVSEVDKIKVEIDTLIIEYKNN